MSRSILTGTCARVCATCSLYTTAGATHLKGLPRVDDSGPPAAVRPYQVVEFDGHRLDVRLKVVVRDPLGFSHEFEMERVWLLVIIAVCTRAVIGYHICLAREYGCYDVIKTIENALTPHCSRTFTIPGLTYGPHDGFPSGRMPELGYVTWEGSGSTTRRPTSPTRR
ncbi:hypothetical protein [Paraburkholderia strydomiana]|uniref:Uncharacterized protein n=1 Tax=Paraburkholderia strydomiana TaxID=1245417 RepID=A0ABW9CCA6_9BURK